MLALATTGFFGNCDDGQGAVGAGPVHHHSLLHHQRLRLRQIHVRRLQSVVACAVFTRISLPEMHRRNYDKAFACGTIAAAGMHADTAQRADDCQTEQFGKLLIAGVGPGILLTLIFTGLVAMR